MSSPSQPFLSFSEMATVLVPTYNPGPLWVDFLSGLQAQTPAPAHCWVLDSESTDGSLAKTAQAGLVVHTVQRKSFDQGGTRQWGIDGLPAGVEFVVLLTHEAVLAARLLQQGHAIRYEAQALVYHSHNYSLASEFARYFDTGVFHHDENWMIQNYGKAGREGLRFLKSEIRFLLHHAPWRLPEALLRTTLKALAYRLGRSHMRLPVGLKKQLSMHKGFWA